MIPYSQAVEQLEEEKPKIYTLNSIRVATFIFGPLAAGYLVSQNYKAFNEKDKSTTTWIIAVVALIAIIGLAVITSSTERFPRFIFPLAYAWGLSYLYKSSRANK